MKLIDQIRLSRILNGEPSHKIVRKVIHGQEVDVKVYDPPKVESSPTAEPKTGKAGGKVNTPYRE